jgi:hypothetical protein
MIIDKIKSEVILYYSHVELASKLSTATSGIY